MTDQSIEILLVEDNPDDVELTLNAFRRHKLANQIHVVRDGEEALELLLGEHGDRPRPRPKLILLDLKLPKVDGLEVLTRLKADQQARSIPVIMLTSSTEERDIVRSYELGVNSYIVKPVDFDQFTQAVRQLGLYWLLLNRSPGA